METSAWRRWLVVVEPWEQRLARPWPTVLIATSALLVLLLAGLPFGLWYGAGPARFESLDLGGPPPPAPLPDQPAAVGAPGGAPATSDRLAPDIPLDLGPDVRVTLVFSVGSRDLSAADAERLRINDADTRGQDGLTDVVMLVIADPSSGRVALFSLPRDLYLSSRSSRINATWTRHGTQALVDDVALVTGLPIHHVVQVNFTAFGDLVDRLGGVALSTDRSLADLASVLYVPGPGCWTFSGADALAYVRSRKTLTLDGDRWVNDRESSDFGRIGRQQQLIGAAFDQLRGPQLVRRVPDLLAVARDGLVVDRGLGLAEVRGLASAFAEVSAGTFEGFTVPTDGRTIGGASVLVADQAAVRPMMERLRSWPPDDGTALAAPDTPLAAPAAPSPTATDVERDTGCSAAVAKPLPDPRAPLLAIAEGGTPTGADPSGSSGGATSTDDTTTGDDTSTGSGGETGEPASDPSDGSSEPAPSPTASEQPSPAPSGEPSPSSPQPSPEESTEPPASDEPSDEESSDDDILPLP